MHVGGCGTPDHAVHVVDVGVPAVAVRLIVVPTGHRPGTNVDTTDKRDLVRGAGVDQPGLLVLAAHADGIPAGLPGRAASVQKDGRLLVAGEGVVSPGHLPFGVPDENPHVDPTPGSAIHEVEEGPAPSGERGRRLDEGDTDPDR